MWSSSTNSTDTNSAPHGEDMLTWDNLIHALDARQQSHQSPAPMAPQPSQVSFEYDSPLAITSGEPLRAWGVAEQMPSSSREPSFDLFSSSAPAKRQDVAVLPIGDVLKSAVTLDAVWPTSAGQNVTQVAGKAKLVCPVHKTRPLTLWNRKTHSGMCARCVLAGPVDKDDLSDIKDGVLESLQSARNWYSAALHDARLHDMLRVVSTLLRSVQLEDVGPHYEAFCDAAKVAIRDLRQVLPNRLTIIDASAVADVGALNFNPPTDTTTTAATVRNSGVAIDVPLVPRAAPPQPIHAAEFEDPNANIVPSPLPVEVQTSSTPSPLVLLPVENRNERRAPSQPLHSAPPPPQYSGSNMTAKAVAILDAAFSIPKPRSTRLPTDGPDVDDVVRRPPPAPPAYTMTVDARRPITVPPLDSASTTDDKKQLSRSQKKRAKKKLKKLAGYRRPLVDGTARLPEASDSSDDDGSTTDSGSDSSDEVKIHTPSPATPSTTLSGSTGTPPVQASAPPSYLAAVAKLAASAPVAGPPPQKAQPGPPAYAAGKKGPVGGTVKAPPSTFVYAKPAPPKPITILTKTKVAPPTVITSEKDNTVTVDDGHDDIVVKNPTLSLPTSVTPVTVKGQEEVSNDATMEAVELHHPPAAETVADADDPPLSEDAVDRTAVVDDGYDSAGDDANDTTHDHEIVEDEEVEQQEPTTVDIADPAESSHSENEAKPNMSKSSKLSKKSNAAKKATTPPAPSAPAKKTAGKKAPATKPKPLAPLPAPNKKQALVNAKKKRADDDALLDEIVRTSSNAREGASFARLANFSLPPGVYLLPIRGKDNHITGSLSIGTCLNVELFKAEYAQLQTAAEQLQYLNDVDELTTPLEVPHVLLTIKDAERVKRYHAIAQRHNPETSYLHYFAKAHVAMTQADVKAEKSKPMDSKRGLLQMTPFHGVIPNPNGNPLYALNQLFPLLRSLYTNVGFHDLMVILTRQHIVPTLADDRIKPVYCVDTLALLQPYITLMYLLFRDLFITTRCGSVMKYLNPLMGSLGEGSRFLSTVSEPDRSASLPLYCSIAAYHYASFGDIVTGDKWMQRAMDGAPPAPHEKSLYLKFLGEAAVRLGRAPELQRCYPKPTELSFYLNNPHLVDSAMMAYGATNKDDIRALMVYLYGRTANHKKSVGLCVPDELWLARMLTVKRLPGDAGIDSTGALFDINSVGDKFYELRLLEDVLAPVFNIGGSTKSSLTIEDRRRRVEKFRAVAALTESSASSRTQAQGIELFMQAAALLEHQMIMDKQHLEGADVLESLWKLQQSVLSHQVAGRVEARFVEDVERLLNHDTKLRYRFWPSSPTRAPSQCAVQFTFTYLWDHMELIATVRSRPNDSSATPTDQEVIASSIIGSFSTKLSEDAMMVLFTDSALIRAIGTDLCQMDNFWREHIPHTVKAVAHDCRVIMNKNPELYRRAYDDLSFCLETCYDLFMRPLYPALPLTCRPGASRAEIRKRGASNHLVVIARGAIDVLPFHIFRDKVTSTFVAEQCVLSRGQSVTNLAMAHLLREYNDGALQPSTNAVINQVLPEKAKLFSTFSAANSLVAKIIASCPHGAAPTFLPSEIVDAPHPTNLESAVSSPYLDVLEQHVAEVAIKREQTDQPLAQNRIAEHPLLMKFFMEPPAYCPIVLDVPVRSAYEREAVLAGGFVMEGPNRYLIAAGVELVMWRSLTLSPLAVCTRAGLGMPCGPASYPDTRPGLHRCLLMCGTSRVLIPWRFAAEYVDEVSLRVSGAALRAAQDVETSVSSSIRAEMIALMDEGHSVNTWGAFSFYGVD